MKYHRNYLDYVALMGLVLLAVFADASETKELSSRTQKITCPNVYPCSCIVLTEGFSITCSGSDARPDSVKNALQSANANGPIAKLALVKLSYNYFNYVPDDFLEGADISSVSFSCDHSFDSTRPPLTFSYNAFQSSQTGRCGLTGDLNITNCNLRQLDSEIFTGCNRLTAIRFENNYIENILHTIPRLDSLFNLTIFTNRQWSNTIRRGVSHILLTAEALPSLRYLDLSGNNLQDDVFVGIEQLVGLEQLLLDRQETATEPNGNSFSIVPNLKPFFFLDTFTIKLNDSLQEVNIRLPDPKKTYPPLNATIKTVNNTLKGVKELSGYLFNSTVNLLFLMDGPLEESIFLKPLQDLSNTGLLVFNNASRFDCSCDMTWLLRDRPSLVNRIQDAYCLNGRPFSAITSDELSCCPTYSLVQQLEHLEAEVERLKGDIQQCRNPNII